MSERHALPGEVQSLGASVDGASAADLGRDGGPGSRAWRHHRDAATPCCPGLRRGPNPPRSLRQRWRQGFVLRPAARDVHSSSVAVVVSNSFSYFLTLPNAAGRVATVFLKTGLDTLELRYRVGPVGDPLSESWEVEVVRLLWTPCHYGGRRPWFRCPGIIKWARGGGRDVDNRAAERAAA